MTQPEKVTCNGDPETCRKNGYLHGQRGLLPMGPRCDAWVEGRRAGVLSVKIEQPEDEERE